VHKILAVLYAHNDYGLLKKAMLQLTSSICRDGLSFYFMDIPSEDTHLIQAICECGFRLTETRLHYVFSDFASYCQERYQVRQATEEDIESLRKVAVEMRNPYDRLHADVAFSQETADKYLGSYVENAVRGFADLVVVPAEDNDPPDAWIASLIPVMILDKRVAQGLAAAVSSRTRKGWMKKLMSEWIYILREQGADYTTAITQASNMQANTVWQSLGFTLRFVTHVFSKRIGPNSSTTRHAI